MVDVNELIFVAKLATKIAGVMGCVQGVAKSGYNKDQGYAFVQEADAMDAIRKACLENGLVILPSMVAVEQEPTGSSTRSGAPNVRTTVRVQYDLIDTETGYALSKFAVGEAIEAQDKGVNKAFTAAGKYFYLKTFMVPSGVDPDGSDPERKEEDAPPSLGFVAYMEQIGANGEQRGEVVQLCKAAGGDISKFAAACQRRGVTQPERVVAAAQKLWGKK